MIKQKQIISFVVQIWLERENNGNPVWRGHIRHVQGNREMHFQNLSEMSGFMEQVSHVPGPASIKLVNLEDLEFPEKPKN